MMAFRAVKAPSLNAPSMRGGSGSGLFLCVLRGYMCKDTKRKSILQEKVRISSDHFKVGGNCHKSGETLCFRTFRRRSERVGNRSEESWVTGVGW